MKIIHNIKKFIRHIVLYQYSKDVHKLIDAQYDKIYKHKKKIKRINKYWNIYDSYGLPTSAYHAIKNHRYLINKAYKEIEGIKTHYSK